MVWAILVCAAFAGTAALAARWGRCPDKNATTCTLVCSVRAPHQVGLVGQTHPDAVPGAGVDHIARPQHHEFEVLDQVVNLESHVRGIAVLA